MLRTTSGAHAPAVVFATVGTSRTPEARNRTTASSIVSDASAGDTEPSELSPYHHGVTSSRDPRCRSTDSSDACRSQ